MDFKTIIAHERQQPYYQQLEAFVNHEYQIHTVYPPRNRIFHCFNFKDYDAVLVEVNLYNRQAILISNPNSSSIQFLQNDWGDTVYFVQAIVNMNEDSFTITSTQTYIYGGAVGKRNGSASVKKIIGFKKLIK